MYLNDIIRFCGVGIAFQTIKLHVITLMEKKSSLPVI